MHLCVRVYVCVCVTDTVIVSEPVRIQQTIFRFTLSIRRERKHSLISICHLVCCRLSVYHVMIVKFCLFMRFFPPFLRIRAVHEGHTTIHAKLVHHSTEATKTSMTHSAKSGTATHPHHNFEQSIDDLLKQAAAKMHGKCSDPVIFSSTQKTCRSVVLLKPCQLTWLIQVDCYIIGCLFV